MSGKAVIICKVAVSKKLDVRMIQVRKANVTSRFAPATNTEAPAMIAPIIQRMFFRSLRRLPISDDTSVRRLPISDL